MVLRDFNEILYPAGKEGGRQQSEHLMINFRETLEVCEFADLGYKGDPFTWSNKHDTVTFTKERLDRAVANQNWVGIYDNVEIENLVGRSSDHKPLIASC